MLHRPDNLTVELADNIGDVAASSVEPGQMDQDGGDITVSNTSPVSAAPQPELARRSTLPGAATGGASAACPGSRGLRSGSSPTEATVLHQ